MKFIKSGQKGFTLIELLVVIAILGTLAGVVVLNVIQFIGKGACEAASTEKHNMQTASVAYTYEHVGSYATGANPAVLNAYLLTTPKGTWTFDSSGVITGGVYTGCATIP